MKRSFNFKFLAILIVAVILVGGGVHALHGMQIRRSATVLLELVDEAEKADDLSKATDYLARYLRLVPDDSKALTRYAELLGSKKLAVSPLARERALVVTEKALLHAPENRDLRRKAVDLALSLGLFDAAWSHLKILKDSAPDDGEIHLLLGQTEESRGKFEEAREAYMDAIVRAPEQIDGYVRLADLLRRRFTPIEKVRLTDPLRRRFTPAEESELIDQEMVARELADRVMDARGVKDGLVANNSKSFRAYLERAKYRKAYGIKGANAADDNADTDVARALALAPDEADVLLTAAEAALDRGDLATARTHLDRGLKRYPRDFRMYQGLASLEARARRYDEAIACLKRGLKELPGEKVLQWSLGELLVQRGKTKEARDLITQLREEGFREEILGSLEARLAMVDEHWSEAITILERVRTRLSAQSGQEEFRKRLDLQLAECYRRIGNIDQQHNAALRAVAITLPNDGLAVPARIELASALSAMGRIDGAIDEYRKILALPEPPPEVRISLARLQILKNLSSPAPKRRWKDVEDLLDQAEKTRSGPSPALALARAEALVAQGQLDPADQLLQKAVDQHPENVELRTTRASLADQLGKGQECLSLLDEAQQRLGDHVELRLARGRYWARQSDREAAKAALAKLEQGAESFKPADRLHLLAGLAALQHDSNREAAKRLWTRIASEYPDNLGSRHGLFGLAFQAGDVEMMKQQVQDLRRIEGNEGLFWRFNQVRLTIHQARTGPEAKSSLAEARRLLANVVALRPNWSDVVRTEAELDDLENNNSESALKNYLRAIELGDRTWLSFRRAIGLLVDRGRFEEADQQMRKLQEQTPLTPELERIAVGITLQTQDYQRALDRARKLVSPESKDYREWLWLGQVFWMSSRRTAADGQKAEAEKQQEEANRAFWKAVTLADDKPETWVALIIFLSASGQAAAAEEAFREAEAALPKVLSPLTLAQFYGAVGRTNRAGTLYQDASNRAPDDVDTLRSAATFYLVRNQLKDAEPFIRRLVDLPTLPPEVASWARTTLPQVIASQGGYEKLRQAEEILGSSTTGTLADRRARANLLALLPLRSRLREAIRILEQIVEHENPTSSDRFLLVQLLDKDGEWPKARTQLQTLMTVASKQPAYPTYLAYYTRALVQHKEMNEAQIWLGRLEQMQPEEPTTIEIKARVLVAQKRGEDAAALLTRYVEGKDALVGRVAALLESLGQPKAAEALYRRFAALPGRPEKVLTMAGFLARQGRPAEALDVCEGAWKTCSAESVAQASLSVLHTARPDNAQFRRVERWLTEATQKEPNSIALQFDLATFWSLEGRYDEAEAIYRQVTERAPKNGASWNNLAWLIATRGEKASEALDYVNRAIALDGPSPSFLDTRAVVSLALGRSQDAIKDLEEALATAPNTPVSYLHLAQARLMAGDRAAAAEALKAAKDTGLQLDTLHPLERPVYLQLEGELARK
jgi:tetratricopeptide (TPR) repeat protein